MLGSEHFQRLVLWRRGKGKVAGSFQHLTSVHPLLQGVVDLVFGIRESFAHCRSRLTSLARMCFIDNDRKRTSTVLVPNLFQNEGELLHGGDDDLLPVRDEAAQVARLLGMTNSGADLHELFDRLLELVV